MLKRKQKASDVSVPAFKAFDAGMTCRGFHYVVGQDYQHIGDVKLCSNGFHAVTVPFDAWGYYPGSKTFARVTLRNVSSQKDNDSKIVGAKITIEATLSLPDWIKAQAAAVIGLCKAAKKSMASKKEQYAAATGNFGHAAATGDSGHAAATGYRGHAAATGNNGVAAAVGQQGTARAVAGGFVVLVQYDSDGRPCGGFFSAVGVNGIDAGKNYRLNAAGAVEAVPDNLICA